MLIGMLEQPSTTGALTQGVLPDARASLVNEKEIVGRAGLADGAALLLGATDRNDQADALGVIGDRVVG